MKAVNTSIFAYIFPNINEDGWKFVFILALISLLSALIWIPLGGVFLLITVICFYGFRDPIRVTPVISDAVIAPCDGIVTSITKEKGPEVLGLEKKKFNKISVYTNIFNVNINRIPIKCSVVKSFYDCGKPLSKSFDKNNIGNERMLIHLKNNTGADFIIQQTATFCNKRIINKFNKGDEFVAGQRFGFIRLGGYIDLYIPEKNEFCVCIGQHLVGAETIIADIKSDLPRMEGEIR